MKYQLLTFYFTRKGFTKLKEYFSSLLTESCACLGYE